jgi:hypothetical protein
VVYRQAGEEQIGRYVLELGPREEEDRAKFYLTMEKPWWE